MNFNVRKLFWTSLVTIPLLIAAGCSKAPEGTVADYQSSQMAAKQNCQRNADDYLAAAGTKDTVIMDTDSSISRKYLQGDGWCSGHFTVKGRATNQKLYCRSNRGGGCKPVRPKDDGEVNMNLDHSVPIAK